ncbi:helix-turn-helix domain-containing protein [Corynebacterium singulare]|uniref:helix-turn-helix domain-containing protein n=1 Tax=Corynebacterium singulare TaxID=161899 RepID=UPI003B8A8C90
MDPVEILKHSALSLSDISRRTGVSRNTLNLWLQGTTQPSLETLDKVLCVLGYEVFLSVRRMSNAGAATAARVLLEELEDDSPEVIEWINRFRKWGDVPVDDASPLQLIERAAWASNPYGRAGACHFLPTNPITLASAAQALGQRWALSGTYARAHGPRPYPGCGGRLGSTLIWCEDPAAILPSLPQRVRLSADPIAGGVTLCPAAGRELDNMSVSGGVQYASELQVDIDVHAERYAGSETK